MIVREYYTTLKSGVKIYKTYSDSNHYIQKENTNEKYIEALDVETALFKYIELEETFIPDNIE